MSGKPKHLAIVMDGNGRWASRNGYPRAAGHRQGMETTLRIIDAVADRGINYLSLFALSCENMSRPQQELKSIENLISAGVGRFRKIARNRQVSLRVIGDISVLSLATRDLLDELIEENHSEPRLYLQVAINYSGQWDIVQATNRARQHQGAETIGTDEFAKYLSTSVYPDPDLLIRTGGEWRLSNFMLWQMAYTELIFLDKMWPEFDLADLDDAIASYGRRERRFGLISARTQAG